jgi:hypothetical protein
MKPTAYSPRLPFRGRCKRPWQIRMIGRRLSSPNYNNKWAVIRRRGARPAAPNPVGPLRLLHLSRRAPMHVASPSRAASSIPRHPDAARRAYKLRATIWSPERVPCSGFLFVASIITLAQTCNAVFAALLSFRLSAEGTNRGTISERTELLRHGGRAT